MKRRLLLVITMLMLGLTVTGCGSAKDDITEKDDVSQQQEEVSLTSWPTNTIFSKPEGCTIINVRKESYKNYITVEWDSKEAAKAYIEKVKEIEGDSAEIIGQGETDDAIYYGTYAITITSNNEPENLILYK